jgi:predicted transcriptional regulator
MPPAALDDVEFLAGSPTRVTVLALVGSGPRTRDDLKSATDVSRVTLSRILSELEDRNWIVRSDGRYEATPLGEYIADDFTQLLANVETAGSLEAELDWLPTDRFGFDLHCLRDAEIVTPSQHDHTAAVRRVADAARNAEWVRSTATGLSMAVVQALRDVVVERDGPVELVLAPTAIDIIRTDAGLRPLCRELLEAAPGSVARYEGDNPILMMLETDVAVLLCGHDEHGPPPGTVATTDQTVRAWARDYFQSRWADAEPLDVEAFTP